MTTEHPLPAEEVATKIRRYSRARMRLAQALIPFAILGGAAARHFPGPLTAILGGGLLLFVFVTVARARRSFGRRTLRFRSGKITFGEQTDERIVPKRVTAWTFSDGLARLYEDDVSWALEPVAAGREQLRACLSSCVGPPRELHTRGSRRAQQISAGVAVLGVVILAVGFMENIVPFGPLGGLAILGGWSMNSFYKMKIADPDPTESARRF
jgi:hypothetical protein